MIPTEHTRELELKSSAITLSDMEIFVFPELMFSLLLANLMSPRIWEWRHDQWFDGLDQMKPYRRILRLKQYIMDHYAFNLDLDTWGLTTKQREINRFKDFIDAATLSQSNALFGYEGDRYYFSMDIRKHFGLDKYKGDIIPYWKTETVEAMDAFQFKPNCSTGAGECVSLAALYAAALFIVARIPLSSIFMMATPLHSQNFVDVAEGILTNNRRLVTKQMWFNGTALSAQARRALENERVTVVAHESGWLHTVYPEATIDRGIYKAFAGKLKSFLQTTLTPETLGNFIRHRPDLQQCFQVRWPIRGTDKFITAARVFAYEQDSPYRLTDKTRPKLMDEIDSDEFQHRQMPGGIILNDLEDYVQANQVDLTDQNDVARLTEKFACNCLDARAAIGQLISFCRVVPQLPEPGVKKSIPSGEVPGLSTTMERKDVIARLAHIREHNHEAALAFYAYRDLNMTEPEPFLLAAMERSPVSIAGASGLSDDETIAEVVGMTNRSIYDEDSRLAQPDEVWNFKRGDGVEKALTLANILHQRHPGEESEINVTPNSARLQIGSKQMIFPSTKNVRAQTWHLGGYAVLH